MNDEREVIYVYTDDQAIEDGVLVEPFPDKAPGLLITASIEHDINKAVESGERNYVQVAMPLLYDATLMVQRAISEGRQDNYPFVLEGTVAGTVWIMPNGKGGFTILKPEDY